MSQPLVPVDHVTIIPDRLSATVSLDYVSPAIDAADKLVPAVDCWIFATRGMEAVGHPELVLAVLRTTETYPGSPFGMFHAIFQRAEAGEITPSGTRLSLSGSTVDFDGRVSGFLCLDFASSWARLPAIDRTAYGVNPLLLVPLIGGELQTGDSFGHGRILALLGKNARCFPYPWWHDPRRASVANADNAQPSILSQYGIPRVHLPDVEVVHSGPHLDIFIVREDCAKLHTLLSTGPSSFVLFPGLSPSEDARYVWEPGQTQPSAIMRTGGGTVVHADLVIGVNFLMLLHGDIENATKLMEDGVVAMLPEPLWQRFMSALESGQEFTWRSAGDHITEISLRLTYRRYDSPFGSSYSGKGPGKFHVYNPKLTREGPATGVEYHNIAIDHITMLTADHKLEQATTVHDLGQYMTDACQIIDDELDGVVHPYDSMVVHVRLAPDARPYVSFVLRPDDQSPWRPEFVDRLIIRLLDLRPPPVARFEVRFELWLTFSEVPDG